MGFAALTLGLVYLCVIAVGWTFQQHDRLLAGLVTSAEGRVRVEYDAVFDELREQIHLARCVLEGRIVRHPDTGVALFCLPFDSATAVHKDSTLP